MTVTVAQFRQDFPEFASTVDYADAQITFYLNLAIAMLNASRWSTVLDFGTELFIAHNLSLERRAQKDGAVGGIPGATVGALNSKSVDKASAGYDMTSSLELDAGHWNLSTYGKRFIHMARLIGAGPVQVGVPVGCVDPLSSANAWIGPYPFPGWFSS